MFLNLSTTRVNGDWMYFKTNNDNFLLSSGSGQFIKHVKPIVAQSDDRLKENEIITESACEPLSKLKPRLYYKKQDIENKNSTTWMKQNGIIAQ